MEKGFPIYNVCQSCKLMYGQCVGMEGKYVGTMRDPYESQADYIPLCLALVSLAC
jgi:hypothetical protein